MKEHLSFVATMYRQQDGSFEAKKFALNVQVPHQPGSTNTDKLLLFGTTNIDLAVHAAHVGEEARTLVVDVPLRLRPDRVLLVHGTIQVRL